jgi:hypothetical protein
MGDHAATAGTGQTITLGKAFIIYLINVGVVSLLIFLASIADFLVECRLLLISLLDWL